VKRRHFMTRARRSQPNCLSMYVQTCAYACARACACVCVCACFLRSLQSGGVRGLTSRANVRRFHFVAPHTHIHTHIHTHTYLAECPAALSRAYAYTYVPSRMPSHSLGRQFALSDANLLSRMPIRSVGCPFALSRET